MSDQLSEFTPEEVGQLLEYLRFEQQKRREMRTEISGSLADLLNEQLEASVVYSGKDARELLEKLPELLDKTVCDELERSRDINIVLIQTIFEQAQSTGIALALNTPDLNNEQLTDQANALCGQILARGESYSRTARTAARTVVKQPSEETLNAIRAENARLRDQLKHNKRDWPEFQELVQKLKEKNAEIHQLQARLTK
jgi:hypothetical protein